MRKTTVFFITVFFIFSANISSSKPLNEVWMEIYSGENKVGHIFRKISESGINTKINEQTVLMLDLLGTETEMKISSEYFLVNNKISTFKYDVSSSSVALNLTGSLHDNKLTIVDLADNRSQEYFFKYDYIVPSLLPEYIFQNGLREGSSFEVYLFDPVNIYTGYDPNLLKASVKVLGVEKVETKSGVFSANKVSVNFLGAENTIWIKKDGTTVLEKFEPSLTAVVSSRDEALKKSNKTFDIAEKTSIASNRYIHNPREVKKMVVTIGGLENTEGLILDDGNYQSFSDNVLTIKSPDFSNLDSYKLPYDSGNLYGGYMEATRLIQNDDPEILKQAKKIIKSENNPVLAVKLINDWTYSNIEKIPTVSIPSAVDVLKTLKGDCNEHAVLFAALARAVGIPVKVVLGVVYLEGRFYYHAWNEAYIGKWIPIDSTFGQIPSDATHIKLIEGDISKSPDILKVVGKIRLEVIETD